MASSVVKLLLGVIEAIVKYPATLNRYSYDKSNVQKVVKVAIIRLSYATNPS
jgi:hypothetical protein